MICPVCVNLIYIKPDPNKAGQLVVCSINGKNFSEPDMVGKAIKIPKKQVKLPPNHRDGEVADIFVQHYDKQKLTGGTSVTALKKSKL